MSAVYDLPICELAEVNPPLPKHGLCPEDIVSFIPMSDVSESGQWVTRQQRHLREIGPGYTPFAEGDVLFAKITPCMENGKGAHAVGLENDIGFGSTEFHVLRARLPNSARFIFHWLQTPIARQRAIAYMGGSAGQQRVQSEFFAHFAVPEIRSDDQHRIAAILDTVDLAIAQSEAVIAKLKSMRAGLLHDLLTRGLDAKGQLRPPPAQAPHLYKDSPLGKIPSEWEYGGLSDRASSARPYLKTGPFGSSLKQEHWTEQGVPVVTIGSLGEGEFISSELLHVSFATARGLSAYALLPGDIVFSRVADVGRSVVVQEVESGWIMSSNMMWISLDQARVVPRYVQLHIAGNPAIRAQVRALVNAGGRDVANAEIMNSLVFPWPPRREQEAAVGRLLAFDGDIHAEALELWKMRLLKSGLMSDLLTGRVRVPSDEIAWAGRISREG